MKKLLTKILWLVSRSMRIHSINRNLAISNLNKILSNSKFLDKKNLINCGFKCFSQSDEDGIIEEIFKRIGIKYKKFLEIGAQDGLECNTTFLLHQNWSGVWMEQNIKSCENIKNKFSFLLKNKLKLINKKINNLNINSVIENTFSENEEIDLLSIDIGIHTYHVLENIKTVRPRVIVTEYNAKFGPSAEWKIKYNQNENWDGSDYFGASLKSFEKMLSKKNYLLVGCNITGVNAFFVRKDLINDDFINNYSSEFHYENLKQWLLKAFEPELKVKIGEFE